MRTRTGSRGPRQRRVGAAAVAVAAAVLVVGALWARDLLPAGTGFRRGSGGGARTAPASGSALAAAASAASPIPPPEVTARSAVLLDPTTGAVLYAKNPRLRVYPASTTKILTALVALTHSRLDGWVTVSARAVNEPGSTLGLRTGDRLRLEDLLYGMMLTSGNDAAQAVAEHVAGSTAAFARLMNRQAAEAGATGSHFTNPSGLPDPELYTTALDMARIARRAVAIPLFARMAAARRYTITFAGGRRETVYNHNRLLGRQGVDGVKTGYTRAAGHTYVASARRGGHLLLASLFGDTKGGKYLDALALFHYGFSLLHAGRAAATAGPPLPATAEARIAPPGGSAGAPPAWPDPLPWRAQSRLQ